MSRTKLRIEHAKARGRWRVEPLRVRIRATHHEDRIRAQHVERARYAKSRRALLEYRGLYAPIGERLKKVKR